MGEAALPFKNQPEIPSIVPHQPNPDLDLQVWKRLVEINSFNDNEKPQSSIDVFIPEEIIGSLTNLGGGKFRILNNEIELTEKQAGLLLKIINDYAVAPFNLNNLAESLKTTEYNVRCMIILINTSILYQGLKSKSGNKLLIVDEKDKNVWRINPEFIGLEG